MNLLEQTIIEYQGKGWTLLSQVGNTAQLRKPKHFGFVRFLFCILGLLTFGILTLFLLLDYWVRKTPMILLTWDGQNVKKKTLAW